jgi:hypothetical protein
VTKADGDTFADQAAYHIGIRGVHFVGSVLTGLVHLPVSTIVTKVQKMTTTIHLSLSPHRHLMIVI